MKSPIVITLCVVLLAGAAFLASFQMQTAPVRALTGAVDPELEWLKREFAVNEQAFEKVKTLHQTYLPACERMCLKIQQANAQLETLVLNSDKVTPEIDAKLHEIALIQEECHRRMLAHFYDVSRSMSPDQAQRYLQEMHRITSLSNNRKHSSAKHGH
jgi:hypothetical protein